MKKFILTVVYTLLVCSLGYSQTGQGYINYKSYKINGGNGSCGPQHPSTTAAFDTMFDYTNNSCTELTHEGNETATKALTWPCSIILPRHANSWFGWDIDGYFVAEESGAYIFLITSDDRSDFWFDTDGDGDMDDTYAGFGNGSRSRSFNLTAGQAYPFRVRYEQGAGGANLYLKWKRPSDSALQFNSDEIYSYHPDDAPHSLDITYEVSDNLDATKFSTTIYYECTDNAGGICATVNTLGSDGTISFDETAISTDQVSNGTLKATTTNGNVEWVVLYPYDSINDRHRILIDGREFTATNPDTNPNNLSSLQLLDLYDGPISIYSVSFGSGGWQQYYIPGNLTTAISNSSYGSDVIRNAGYYFGIRAEFTFGENTSFAQHTINLSVDGTYYDEQYENAITIQDLSLAFSELTTAGSGGPGGGAGGEVFSTGIEYILGDVNEDSVFDFKDTALILQHIFGETDPFADKTFVDVAKVFSSGYDTWSTTDWSSGIPNTTSDYYTPNTTTVAQTKTYQVAFLGDVNFSHSHEPSNLIPQVNNLNSIKTSSTNGDLETSIALKIIREEDNLTMVINIPANSLNISGTQFKINFDETRLEYIDAEYSNEAINSYDTKRTDYINIGSFSSDGSININSGIEYKLNFKLNASLKSTLGLLGIKFYELVTKEGSKVNLKIK
jgi:hypothetical protein